MNKNVNLAAPWTIWCYELKAMFENDDEVEVKIEPIEGGNYVIKIFVEDNNKADALFRILEKKKEFGNVVVTVEVIPANPVNEMSPVDLFEIAFNDNPALQNVVEQETPFGVFNYAVFNKEVVQYYNDDMSSLYGIKSTLYENIAKDIFDKNLALNYCTAIGEENE